MTALDVFVFLLLIGGAAGSAVAAEFVIPLLLVAAGGALLALLLLRIALEVIAALVYVPSLHCPVEPAGAWASATFTASSPAATANKRVHIFIKLSCKNPL